MLNEEYTVHSNERWFSAFHEPRRIIQSVHSISTVEYLIYVVPPTNIRKKESRQAFYKSILINKVNPSQSHFTPIAAPIQLGNQIYFGLRSISCYKCLLLLLLFNKERKKERKNASKRLSDGLYPNVRMIFQALICATH